MAGAPATTLDNIILFGVNPMLDHKTHEPEFLILILLCQLGADYLSVVTKNEINSYVV